ncbi:MAG: hypothetical protein ACNA75_04020 [Thiohalomonadaceae bacterium]
MTESMPFDAILDALAKPYPMPPSSLYEREHGEMTLNMCVDAVPLRLLLETASHGPRLYELLSIQRPGQLLYYLELDLRASEPALRKMVLRELSKYHLQMIRGYERDEGVDILPILWMDKVFPWDSYDTTSNAEEWLAFRATPAWQTMMNHYYHLVEQARQHLKNSANPLIRHTIAMIENGTHPGLYKARLEPGYNRGMPAKYERMTPAVIEHVIQLLERYQLDSIAAEERGTALWLALCAQQIKRQHSERPLKLYSSDAGVPFDPQDIGCDIHVSCEGMVIGALTILPEWRVFDAERAEKQATLHGGLEIYPFPDLPECKIMLSQRDFGELSMATRTALDGWNVYIAKQII